MAADAATNEARAGVQRGTATRAKFDNLPWRSSYGASGISVLDSTIVRLGAREGSVTGERVTGSGQREEEDWPAPSLPHSQVLPLLLLLAESFSESPSEERDRAPAIDSLYGNGFSCTESSAGKRAARCVSLEACLRDTFGEDREKTRPFRRPQSPEAKAAPGPGGRRVAWPGDTSAGGRGWARPKASDMGRKPVLDQADADTRPKELRGATKRETVSGRRSDDPKARGMKDEPEPEAAEAEGGGEEASARRKAESEAQQEEGDMEMFAATVRACVRVSC
ncbi:hypothetical protein AXG93_4101s1060 [Marchantia polymorpha subsp. ruderalis]|uniref:Uncharacterized protein n=1 Tax=Marchantia polymorpha subsp. ruderalis TaxID=1480154 RepID=A0A176VB52_MARPO|nr:hypothetical protein AXG93_4101s1060 [Marchantia polymorpha subsp. ruderalis]